MISLITATIGGLLVLVYLGYYAVTLNQVPLWIIIVGVLGMVITDFVLSVRDETRRTKDKESGEGEG